MLNVLGYALGSGCAAFSVIPPLSGFMTKKVEGYLKPEAPTYKKIALVALQLFIEVAAVAIHLAIPLTGLYLFPVAVLQGALLTTLLLTDAQITSTWNSASHKANDKKTCLAFLAAVTGWAYTQHLGVPLIAAVAGVNFLRNVYDLCRH